MKAIIALHLLQLMGFLLVHPATSIALDDASLTSLDGIDMGAVNAVIRANENATIVEKKNALQGVLKGTVFERAFLAKGGTYVAPPTGTGEKGAESNAVICHTSEVSEETWKFIYAAFLLNLSGGTCSMSHQQECTTFHEFSGATIRGCGGSNGKYELPCWRVASMSLTVTVRCLKKYGSWDVVGGYQVISSAGKTPGVIENISPFGTGWP